MAPCCHQQQPNSNRQHRQMQPVAVVDAFVQTFTKDDAPIPLAQPLQDPPPFPLPTITKIKCQMHLLLSHHSKLPLLSFNNWHTNKLWKYIAISSFLYAVMPLFISLLTNFYVAMIAESANRNISAPGNILTSRCFPPLWPPKCQQAL